MAEPDPVPARGDGAVPLATPLAARMRPRSLDDVAGQSHLLAPGAPLRAAIEGGRVGSLLLWGPPGTGKTTLARLVAQHTARAFVPFSAVTDGVARVREVVAEAETRKRMGQGTILFVDEIHRFNRSQQDAFLPHVESGTLVLIGATTENPSFEVNAALLSRLQVHVLRPLEPADVRGVLQRALADVERGYGAAAPGGTALTADDAAVALLAEHADGDARRALGALEAAAAEALARGATTLTVEGVARTLALRVPAHDKSGEAHYDLISAFIKAMRGSDPQGTLYWLARMLRGGEDPRFVARRMVRFASEDVGLADPRALEVAVAARDAFVFLGSPEGELALAEAALYLATAPKSNRVYVAWKAAQALAERHPAAPVPLHLRNAPTALLRSLGYGAGYTYAHDAPPGEQQQDALPPEVGPQVLYDPGPYGFERDIAKRLAWWAQGGKRD